MKKAFTLIELIVGITISMLLMVSVGVFISSGMENIFKGQKVLENMDDLNSFIDNLNKSVYLIQSGSFSPTNTSSGIIFKRGINFSDGGFSYIGTKVLDQIYCNSDAENSKTNNIFIKTFIPFEEQNENIFDETKGGYTGSLSSTGINVGGKLYKSFQKEHRIAIKNGASWDTAVGKTVFGDKFIKGAKGTDIYLNSPTGLATDGTNLYISDTLNNRILYLDNSNKIHLLLNETDGLNEPTGLYYNDNTLYIANSGNGEILKYSSKSTASSPILTMSGFTVNNTVKAEITFSGASTNVLLSSYNKTNIVFTNSSTSTDYLTGSINNLKYYFVNYNPESAQGGCSGNEVILIGDKPIQCVSSGTGKTSNYQNTTLSSIVINNIINTSNTGTYFIDLKLINSSNNIIYQNYFPYFTQGDDILTTTGDNILTVLYSGLNYPTGIWGTGAGNFNLFGDGIYSDLPYTETDNLLNTPINSLDITNTPNNLLTLILKYYRSYNCYNLDEKIEKTFIMKKNLK